MEPPVSDKNEQNNNVKNDPASKLSSIKIPVSAWKTLAILSSLATMVMYAETMLIPAIPDLIREFNVSYSISSWVLTAYLIPGAVMTPIAGKLSDIYGRKRILLMIMVTYAIGIAMAGIATNIYFMLIARAVQGVGMAMFVIAFSIVREQFPREKISIGQGVISSMFASGAVLGLSIGGIIIKNYGWHATFFSTIPIAVALLIIIWRFIHVKAAHDHKEDWQQQNKPSSVPSSTASSTARYTQDNNSSEENGKGDSRAHVNAQRTKIDVKGAITLAAFVTSFLLALTFLETGGNSGTESDTGNTLGTVATVAVFLALGITSFTLFVLIEKRTKSPLVDLSLLLHKAILPSNLIIMIVGFSMFMVFQTVPVLVRNPTPLGFGGDAAAAGYVQLPFAIILLVFGPTSGFIVAKMGSLKPIIIGTIITAIGFLGLYEFHSDWISVSVNLAVLSTGLSLTNVGAMNVTILATPVQFTGISLGMSNLMRIIGSSVGPALAGVYMQTYQSVLNINGVPQSFPSLQAYSTIFLTATLVSAVSIMLAILLRRRVVKMSIPNVT